MTTRIHILYRAVLHLAMVTMEDVTRYTGLGRTLTHRLQVANDRWLETKDRIERKVGP